jgi:hypothetical protein
MTYKTAPTIEQAILAGTTTWLNAKENTHHYNPQAAIGWELFHYGFLAAEWQHTQEQHYQELQLKKTQQQQTIVPPDPSLSTSPDTIDLTKTGKQKKKKIVLTGPVWASKLIETLWLNLHTAWTSRCTDLHSKEDDAARE